MNYRKAKISDVESMFHLIMDYADKGLMLARSRKSLYEGVREYIVAENEKEEIIAIGALRILWGDLAEVRSLAVRQEYAGQGMGSAIVKQLEAEAMALDIPQVFALTYQQDFFKKCGFSVVEHSALPQKVWRDCIDCPKFHDCDEVGVLKNISRK